MKNDKDIRSLWYKQTVPVVSPSEISSKIKTFKNRGLRKLLVLNIILLLTVCFVMFVWIYFQPQLLSTKIGIVLTILTIVAVILLNQNIIPLYKRIDESRTNSDYIKNLLAVKNYELFMQTRVINFYFIFLSVGIGLYMFEYTFFRHSALFGIVIYSGFLLWIGLNWFILRPKIITKNRKKIDELIKLVERIKQQLSED